MTPQEFINFVAPMAVQVYKHHKLSAAVQIAQAAVESEWGRACPGNNLFGIKAYNWNGPTVTRYTKEYVGGRPITIQAKFRAYPTLGDSIVDHAKFLLYPDNAENRYHNLIGANWKEACHLIGAVDGYATDPHYEATLVSVIEEHQLYNYDK